MVPNDAKTQFDNDGYACAHALFSPEETQEIKRYFTDMVERGGDGWAEEPIDTNHPDPLKRYPRLLQPHRGDQVAKDFMIDRRINEWLTGLLGLEPFAVQTMVYFKPPGARGQALHQDNRFLKVQNGTCVAAWMALDDCDVENGCLEVVPGSHLLDMICPGPADLTQSFTNAMVQIPPGMTTTRVPMKSGDVLFFNGSLIHGSPPNVTSDRFRTIIVGHYIEGQAEAVGKYYHPVYRMDGTILEMEVSPDSTPCGVYVGTEEGIEFQQTGMIDQVAMAH